MHCAFLTRQYASRDVASVRIAHSELCPFASNMSSGFGMQPEFHNSAPRTREERQAALNKDALEKNRLKARAGPHHKPEECGNPLVPEPCSPLYADESSRFARDVAGEMRQQKLAELAKKEVRPHCAAYVVCCWPAHASLHSKMYRYRTGQILQTHGGVHRKCTPGPWNAQTMCICGCMCRHVLQAMHLYISYATRCCTTGHV